METFLVFKVSLCIFAPSEKIMRKEIIITAADLYLTYGFKSVTMDDLAGKMGISKKTIYIHFPNKSKLVEAATLNILKSIDEGIEQIRAKNLNAIVELFEIKKFVMHNLKDEKSSPQFQLKKFYPKVFEVVQKHHLEIMQECISDNLRKGIRNGLFRPSIPIEFISKINYVGISGIKDIELFPVEEYSVNELTEKFMEYHLRAIVTSEGLKTLKEFLTIED